MHESVRLRKVPSVRSLVIKITGRGVMQHVPGPFVPSLNPKSRQGKGKMCLASLRSPLCRKEHRTFTLNPIYASAAFRRWYREDSMQTLIQIVRKEMAPKLPRTYLEGGVEDTRLRPVRFSPRLSLFKTPPTRHIKTMLSRTAGCQHRALVFSELTRTRYRSASLELELEGNVIPKSTTRDTHHSSES